MSGGSVGSCQCDTCLDERRRIHEAKQAAPKAPLGVAASFAEAFEKARAAPTPEVKASPAKGSAESWRAATIAAEEGSQDRRLTIAYQDAEIAGLRTQVEALQTEMGRMANRLLKNEQRAREDLLAATAPPAPPARDTSDEAVLRERVKALQDIIREQGERLPVQAERIVELESALRARGIKETETFDALRKSVQELLSDKDKLTADLRGSRYELEELQRRFDELQKRTLVGAELETVVRKVARKLKHTLLTEPEQFDLDTQLHRAITPKAG